MRGKLLGGFTSGDRSGNIPAHAGKTTLFGSDAMRFAGTSPRMRGKRKGGEAHGMAHQEHPRACGENLLMAMRPPTGSGTSPRMRGKPTHHLAPYPLPRNIPAHAGKTSAPHRQAESTPEHPRACGENSHSDTIMPRTIGTSPRMRGKQISFISLAFSLRNIPAHAGKTLRSSGCQILNAEHPRACGENFWITLPMVSNAGTSPRMRGKLEYRHHDRFNHRNIPAHAGKTAKALKEMGVNAEHPRACGENGGNRVR